MVELKAHLCAVDRLTGPSHRDSKFFAQARIKREVHRLRRGRRPVLRPCYLCREIAILELSIFLCHRKQGRALDLNISQTFKGFFTGSLIASFSHAWPMICWKNDLKTRCWQKKPTPLPKTKATTTTTTDSNSINNNHSTLTLFLNTLNSRSIYWRGGRLCSSGLRRDRQ